MTGFAVTPAQREKITYRDMFCVACGRHPCDPAHVTAKAQGGCGDPLCVVPLCRSCHRDYDNGRLDLVAALEPAHRAEAAHAVMHVGLHRAYWRIRNERAA